MMGTNLQGRSGSLRRLTRDAPNFVLRFSLSLLLLLCTVACALKNQTTRMPAEAEAVIASISDDIAAERYQKVYDEAADLWKKDSSLEQSTSMLQTVRTRLGRVKNRTLHSATEQENSGGPLKGRAFIANYVTNFEHGDGMETFTLVERNGQWLLARYRVNSSELK